MFAWLPGKHISINQMKLAVDTRRRVMMIAFILCFSRSVMRPKEMLTTQEMRVDASPILPICSSV